MIRIFAHPNQPKGNEIEQYKFGEDFLYKSGNNAQQIVFVVRIQNIILTLLLAIIIFVWAKELWGFWGGLISLTLLIFCPNILAHGRLATTDIGSVFYFVLSMWTLRWFTKNISVTRAAILGLVIGLSLAVKFSNIIILPIILITFLILLIVKKINIKRFFGYLFISISLALILLWFIYVLVLQKSFKDHQYEPYLMKYTPLQGKTISSWYSKAIFMPADSFLEGFFFVRDHNEFGHLSYLDGQYSSMGWREYFPKTFWYKTLIPTMILFALSLLVMLKIRANYLEEIFIFLLPIIYFLISINSKLNIGIRHILIIYPFIYLSIGRLAKLEFKNIYFNYLTKIFIIVLLSWVVVESIYYYPSDIAYFNQIAGGPQNGYRHLADSNIDWGQDIKRLRLYMDKKNYNYSLLQCDGSAFYDYYGINTRKAGDMSLIKNDYITLRIFCFLMPSEEAEKDPLFQKLKKMQPIDNVGHSILIYKINN